MFLDYLGYDPAHHNVWVPAGGTGRVDIIDATTGKLTSIEGFPVQEMERHGHKRQVGPSSVTIGDGVAYVGNRGDSTVCAFELGTLAKQGCVTLDAMPDGLPYIASTKEVWVTTPRDSSIRTLDVATPDAPVTKDVIRFDRRARGICRGQCAQRVLHQLRGQGQDAGRRSEVARDHTHLESRVW